MAIISGFGGGWIFVALLHNVIPSHDDVYYDDSEIRIEKEFVAPIQGATPLTIFIKKTIFEFDKGPILNSQRFELDSLSLQKTDSTIILFLYKRDYTKGTFVRKVLTLNKEEL